MGIRWPKTNTTVFRDQRADTLAASDLPAKTLDARGEFSNEDNALNGEPVKANHLCDNTE